MAKEIIIEIDEEGNIKLETIGFKGASCLETSKQIKKMLGKELSKKLSPSYYFKENEKITEYLKTR